MQKTHSSTFSHATIQTQAKLNMADFARQQYKVFPTSKGEAHYEYIQEAY